MGSLHRQTRDRNHRNEFPMGARILDSARLHATGAGMSYDGTENDRPRFAADQIARLDKSAKLLHDDRVLRLMMDPLYVTLWRNTIRAYVQSEAQGSSALIATLAMLTLASLDQYDQDGTAVNILAAAFDDEDLFKQNLDETPGYPDGHPDVPAEGEGV